MKKLFLITLILLLSNCYTYLGDEVQVVREIKAKSKIDSISFRLTGIKNAKKLNEYNLSIKKALEKSEMFGKVVMIEERLEKAEKHHLEINLKRLDVYENTWLFAASAIIMPFTIGTIPAFDKNKYTMTVDYYIDGKMKRYHQFQQSYTQLIGWYSLFQNKSQDDSIDDPEAEIVKNLTNNSIFYTNELNYADGTR